MELCYFDLPFYLTDLLPELYFANMVYNKTVFNQPAFVTHGISKLRAVFRIMVTVVF